MGSPRYAKTHKPRTLGGLPTENSVHGPHGLATKEIGTLGVCGGELIRRKPERHDQYRRKPERHDQYR
jgi:hypothetical protein